MNDWLRGIGGSFIVGGIWMMMWDIVDLDPMWQVGLIVGIIGIVMGSVGEWRDTRNIKARERYFDQPWNQ